VWHDSFVCVTWLIHKCDMTHSYMWRDSFIRVTELIHMCVTTHSYVCHDSFICTCLLHMCDVTHSHLLSNSCISVTWLIYMYDVTRSYVCRDSFVFVTCLIRMCDMTHSYLLLRAVPKILLENSSCYLKTRKLSLVQLCSHSFNSVGYGSQTQLFDWLQWGRWQSGPIEWLRLVGYLQL